MDNLKNTIKKSINYILLIIIPILIFLSNKGLAAYNWYDALKNIPHTENTSPLGSEAPWYVAGGSANRTVSYPNPVHYQAFANDEEQNVYINSNAVYCCDLYSHVRAGEFDEGIIFIASGDEGATTPNEALQWGRRLVYNYPGYYIDGPEAGTANLYTHDETDYGTGKRLITMDDISAYFYNGVTFAMDSPAYRIDSIDFWENYKGRAKDKMIELFGQLGEDKKANWYSTGDYTSDPVSKNMPAVDELSGPIIVIMEKEADTKYGGESNVGYKKTESGNFINNAESYVLTAIRGLYRQGQGEYTLAQIQLAWWALVDTGIPGHTRGNPVYAGNNSCSYIKDDALAYEKYRAKYLDGNNKLKSQYYSVNATEAEAIIDQEEQSYTVGPFTLIYPSGDSEGGTSYSFNQFVYVKGLTVRTYDTPDSTTATNTLYYDEISNDFEIKFPVGHSGTTGGSGLTKIYPRSNNKFYVKIYANGGNGFKACGTPEKVEVSFSLEYLTTSKADYQILESNADMYAYIGHIEADTSFDGFDSNNGILSSTEYNHKAPVDAIKLTAKWKDADYVNRGYYQYADDEPRYGMYQTEQFREDYGLANSLDLTPYYHDTSYWRWVDNEGVTGIEINTFVYQPYIKMSEYRVTNRELLPQKLMLTERGERKYVTILSSKSVTFTMDLGGKVFEDLRRGKKSELDGYYALHELGSDQAQDYPMQNVIVLLYRHNLNNEKGENVLGETVPGQFIGWTKTDENGEYKFEKLNEMYKYHVEFIYNGQYYEPTKYTMYESLNKLTEELKDDLAGQKRKERWEKSSKALESYKERDDFNIKFGEIGASPTNVIPDASGHLQYKSTYREDLEDKKIIDKVLTDNNLRKSAGILLDYNINDQGQLVVTKYNEDYTDFARESLTRAYTYEKYENDQLDLFLYPISEVFVENNVVLSSHRDVMQKSVKALYDNINDDSIDEMHHINLGLVDREEFKVQLLKDVDAVIFEINDKTYTYYYNTRKLNDQLELDKIGYGLDVRAIDGYAYYREDVTREIYREDYEYDASKYKYNSFWRKNEDTGLLEPMNEIEYIELMKAKETGELEIYVRYRMLVKVNSSLIKTEITEIVDYYDKEFTVIGNEATKKSDGTKATEYDRVKDNNVVTQNEVDKYAPYYGELNTSEKITDLSNQYSALSENRIDIKTESKYKESKNAKGVVDPQDAFTENDYNRIYLDTSKVRLDPVHASFTAFVTFRVNKEEVNGERGQHIILDVKDGSEADYIAASKVNIAEINGYKTYYYKEDRAPNYENTDNKAEGEYKENDVAGVVERYSTPGNLEHISKDLVDDVYDNAGNPHKVLRQAKAVSVEPDADMAPLLHIILNKYEKRTIVGNVWEDERVNDDGIVSKGDGKRQPEEENVNGVIVQLVEVKRNNDGEIIEQYIAKQYKTGKTKAGAIKSILERGVSNDTTQTEEGQYAFIGIPAGDYIVRFIYGADASTAIGTTAIDYAKGTTYSNPVVGFCTNAYNEVTDEHSSIYDQSGSKGNTNAHSFTGNDYKSTTYEANVETDVNNTETGTYNLDLGLLSGTENISYAKDIWSRREIVNAYSKEVTNHRAEVLSSFESIPEDYKDSDMNSLLGELYAYTYMVADTGIIDFEVEYNRTNSKYPENSEKEGNNKDGRYNLDGLDFGLERRPRAQLKTTDQVINVKVTLANGNVLFDARDTATNVQWMKHIAHNPDSGNTYKDGENYEAAQLKIPSVRLNGSNGVINLTMDEELMHGSTIEITYAITVANIGEVDYNTLDYYYKGIIPNTDEAKMASIVRTTPREVISYVGYQPNVGARKNNLSFNKAQNPDWDAFKNDKSDIITQTDTLDNKVKDRYDENTTLYDRVFYYNFVVNNESSDEKANNAHKKFETAFKMSETAVDQNIVNFKLKNAIDNYDIIIHTTALADKKLIPIIADGNASENIEDRFANDPINTIEDIRSGRDGKGAYDSVAGVKLILSKVISGDTSGSDMIYNNLVEVVRVSNDVGRRMNYSVVGNQNPNPTETRGATPTEIDADIAQEVSILPPFGQTQRYYYLGFGVAAILLVGTLMVMAFTKKKDDDNTVKVTNEGKK